MTNLAIWNSLGKTDTTQTKGFSRAGGFKGTAVKPIYTEKKMTEEFGPVGLGWGVSEPTFQLVPGSDGQTAVYCWLTIWFVRDGKRSEPIPGVGGDLVIVKQSSGLRTDDEAFKKAFTDAIGNAMKHLGMSADVHMGLFDDSKYLSERRNEEAQERAASKPQPAPANPFDETLDRTIIETLLMAMRQAEDKASLDQWFAGQKKAVRELPASQRDEFLAEIEKFAMKFPAPQQEAA